MKVQLIKETKNIILFLVIGLFVLVVTITGCYSDNEEILYPQTVCDTANVTFNRSIVPVLSANCTSCHGGNTPSAGIKLDNYAGVKIQADNGRLLGTTTHATNYSPMPKNAPKMNTCNITKIKKWLDAGALNN